MHEHRVQESAYTRCGGVRVYGRAGEATGGPAAPAGPPSSSRLAPTAPLASRAHIVVILVAVAGFAVVILAAGSITLLTALLRTALLRTALLRTAWLPAAALPSALAALLATALVTATLLLASLRVAAGIPSRIALRLVAFFRITLRSVAIRHVHASCFQLLGRILQEPIQHRIRRHVA